MYVCMCICINSIKYKHFYIATLRNCITKYSDPCNNQTSKHEGLEPSTVFGVMVRNRDPTVQGHVRVRYQLISPLKLQKISSLWFRLGFTIEQHETDTSPLILRDPEDDAE